VLRGRLLSGMGPLADNEIEIEKLQTRGKVTQNFQTEESSKRNNNQKKTKKTQHTIENLIKF
jgi:hypothetical protein